MHASTRQPNILFLLSDQQRWDTVGCYGEPLGTHFQLTPNLDRLAAEGVRFASAFTPQPVCGPARATLQTGKWPTEMGCHTNARKLPEDEMTIAKWLSQAGYSTNYLGKWHLAGDKTEKVQFNDAPVPPPRRGGYRDYWLASDLLEFTSHGYDGHLFDADGQQVDFPPGHYRADAMTDFALERLDTLAEESRNGRPFLFFISYIEPHHQNDHEHYEGPKGSQERFADFPVPGDLADAEGDWKEELPDYLGCCHSLDENVGRYLARLEELGILEDTLIVYTSDHGSHFRTRNSEYKRACHDGCVHVPMILRGPGFTGGKVVEDLVSLIDLPATLLTAAGLDVPESHHGRALQPLPDGRPDDWREDVFIQISESQCGRALRTHQWKYAVRAPDKGGQDSHSDTYLEDYLYDLRNDPHERDNLVRSPDHDSVRDSLRQRLLERMRQAEEPLARILPAG